MALRQLRLHLGLSLVTVGVLAVGTAAATTIFSVVDAVVLRPLPYEDPEQLVTIWDTDVANGVHHDPVSPVGFMDQRELPVFEDAAAWWRPAVNLLDPGKDPVRVRTIEMSGNLFDVLGVKPQVGAGFPVGGPLYHRDEMIAVISDRLWRSRYSADPSLVGRLLDLNGTPHTVVGVMPPGFHYPDDVDVWQRLDWDMTEHSRSAHFMEAVARLSEGTGLERAQAAIDTLAARLARQHAGTQDSPDAGWGSRLIPLLDNQLGYYQPGLLVLLGAVGLLLTIGILNVATLLLARALSREREMALRAALGASPRQLVTQLLAESLVLSATGALAGYGVAAAALPLLTHLSPVAIPRLEEAAVELPALGLCAAITGAATLLFGLLPALVLLRGRLSTELKGGGRGSQASRRLYSGLVTAEVALACALLVSSGLLVRTVRQMMSTPLGVDADEVVTTRVQLARDAYRDWERVGATHARIIEEIRRQPGVVAAGGGNFLPLEVGWRVPFGVEGDPSPERTDDLPQAQYHSVSEGYFETLRAELAEGRGFTAFDGPGSVAVVVVNEAFASRYLEAGRATSSVVQVYASGIGPLGRNLMASRDDEPPYRFEVVGVVRDVRNAPLGQDIEPAIYFTTRQFPFRELVLAVRGSDRRAARAGVRAALDASAPSVPMAGVQTWGKLFAERSAEPRLLMTILLAFGALAALLAALGVYGLLSWSVGLRTRELAVRLALGARPVSLGRLVLRESLALVVLGLVIGVIVIRIAEGALSRVLYEVSPTDPGSILAAAGLLVAAALLACVPPARRATRVDPVVGLRAE
jgi:predicted permease